MRGAVLPRAIGRSVDEIVSAYSLPAAYNQFSAPERSLRATVQYIFDGR
jgi:hypothetical protein